MQAVKATGMSVIIIIIITPPGAEKYRDVCDRDQERLGTWGARCTRPQRVEQTPKQANVTEGALSLGSRSSEDS